MGVIHLTRVVTSEHTNTEASLQLLWPIAYPDGTEGSVSGVVSTVCAIWWPNLPGVLVWSVAKYGRWNLGGPVQHSIMQKVKYTVHLI